MGKAKLHGLVIDKQEQKRVSDDIASVPTDELEPSFEQASRELLRRRKAQESLIAFTRYTFPAYKPAAHHELVAEKLEAVARGKIRRLLIEMPPRHGKSELASRRFPAWFLGANPTRHIIAASYNADFAADFGRDVRNIVASHVIARYSIRAWRG